MRDTSPRSPRRSAIRSSCTSNRASRVSSLGQRPVAVTPRLYGSRGPGVPPLSADGHRSVARVPARRKACTWSGYRAPGPSSDHDSNSLVPASKTTVNYLRRSVRRRRHPQPHRVACAAQRVARVRGGLEPRHHGQHAPQGRTQPAGRVGRAEQQQHAPRQVVVDRRPPRLVARVEVTQEVGLERAPQRLRVGGQGGDVQVAQRAVAVGVGALVRRGEERPAAGRRGPCRRGGDVALPARGRPSSRAAARRRRPPSGSAPGPRCSGSP